VVGILGAASFLNYVATSHPDSAWRDSVARGAFLVCILTALYLARILLHPSRGAVAIATGKADQGRLRSAADLRYLLTAAILIALAVTSAAGYHHAAGALARHLGQTLALIVILVVFRAIVLRFVRVSQQKVAIAQARKERARREAQQAEGDDQGARAAPIEEQAFEIQAVSEHTFRLVRWLTVFALTVGIWVIWRDVFPAFSFVNRVELWSYTVTTTTGEGEEIQTLIRAQPVHLSDLVLALIVAALTVVLAANGPRILEFILLARLLIEPSVRFAIAALVRYAIVIAGVIIAFQAIGIGWHQVQWLAAAITVGLGFGLQEIFANFISGLIILFERPVRIGDAVTVGDVTGRVTRIRMRATTVTDFDNRELVVPNKEFITSRIMNWTLSSPVTRVTIPVGIAYGSDTALAREVLLKVARECEHVLDDPAPSAIFRSFGESSLDFDLRVYIPKRDVWPEMIDQMHTRIDEAFRQAKIEIAFPQRDVHVRSIRDVLPVKRQPAPEASAGQDGVEGGPSAGKD
jgi:potassium efflux system protein